MPFHHGLLRQIRRQGRQIRSLGTRSTLKLGSRFITRGEQTRRALQKARSAARPTVTPTPRPTPKPRIPRPQEYHMWTMKRYRRKLLGRYNNPLTLSPVELLLLQKWTKIRIETPNVRLRTLPRRKLRGVVPFRGPKDRVANDTTSFNPIYGNLPASFRNPPGDFNDSNRVYQNIRSIYRGAVTSSNE